MTDDLDKIDQDELIVSDNLPPVPIKLENYPENITVIPLDHSRESHLQICSFSPCTEQNCKACRKCNRFYCIMHTNHFSPNFCMDCFNNLSIVRDKFEKIIKEYDENTDQVIVEKRSCTRIKLDEMDWPFLSKWIDLHNDEELHALWEFHYFIIKFIEHENDIRVIKKLKRIREQPTPRLVTTKQSKTKSTTKMADSPDDLKKRLKKQGLPDVVIEQMVLALQQGK